MYITVIDDLLDDKLDRIFIEINKMNLLQLIRNSSKEFKLPSFYDKINSLIDNIIDSVRNDPSIQDIQLKLVEKIIGKYIVIYINILLGLYIINLNDILHMNMNSYIREIIELSKIHSSMKSNYINLYSNENIAISIRNFQMVTNIIFLLNNSQDLIQKEYSKDPTRFEETFSFLGKELSLDFVINNMVGLSLDVFHTIIKTVIFTNIYLKYDKNDIAKVVINLEEKEAEYKYINVISTRKSIIDYKTLYMFLTNFDDYQIEEIYDLLVDSSTVVESNFLFSKENMQNDSKIREMFKKQLILPIVEDFMRIHKYTESSKIEEKKEKDSSKLKNIISSITNIVDIYSNDIDENKKNIKNINSKFYDSLLTRKAIINNEFDEAYIIDKIYKIGSTSLISNPIYSAFFNYRKYPYINFKNLSKDGFVFNYDEITLDVPRYSNFEYFDKLPKDSPLQTRVIHSNKSNIVGIFIPSLPLECIYVSNCINSKSISNNGLIAAQKYLRFISNNKGVFKPLYWLFDLKNDKYIFDSDRTVDINNNNNIKKFLLAIYDNLCDITSKKINEQFIPGLHFHDYIEIVKKLQHKLIDILQYDTYFFDLMKKIYYKLPIKIEEQYDTHEDLIKGFDKNRIILPEYKTDKQIKQIENTGFYYNVVCHHFIKIDKINRLKKNNINQFNEDFYEFYKQYAEINQNGTIICKSCGSLLDIKQYVTIYSPNEVSFNLSLSKTLEQMDEYSKYSNTIKTMKLKIEKISNIIGFNYLSGTTEMVVFRRETIVKYIIDMLFIMNVKYRKNSIAERKEFFQQLFDKYRTSPEYNQLYLFEIDNNIFFYSKNDTDKYKIYKINNITVFIILGIIMELNENQIVNLPFDKIFNIHVYNNKFKDVLFDDLMIKKNEKDYVPITEFPVLCYLLFYISGLISRNNQWIDYNLGEIKKVPVNVIFMKQIIHTFVNLINIILEASQDTHYLFNISCVKIFGQLNHIYCNKSIIDQIVLYTNKYLGYDESTKQYSYNVIKLNYYKLTDMTMNFDDDPDFYNYNDYYLIRKCHKLKHHFIDSELKRLIKINKVNSLTNCPTGLYHKWDIKFNCKLCSQNLDELLKTDYNNNTDINHAVLMRLYDLLTNYYCIDGKPHILDGDICRKCNNMIKNGYIVESNFGDEQKESIYKKFIELQTIRNIKLVETEIAKKPKEHIDYYNKYNQYYYSEFIADFIKKCDNIVGINNDINNTGTYVTNNLFIILNEYLGDMLKKEVVISEHSNKVKFLYDEHYEKSVIAVTDTKHNIIMYYDAITLLYLGYKDKKYVDLNVFGRFNFLKIKMSLENKLYFLGFNNRFVEMKNEILEEKVRDIIYNRFNNLKMIIDEFVVLINLLKSIKHSGSYIDEKLHIIANKYKSTLSKNIDESIFTDWFDFKTLINFKIDLSKIRIEIFDYSGRKFIDVDDIIKLNMIDSKLVFYFIDALNKLLERNKKNIFIQNNFVYLLNDFIEYIYTKDFNNFYGSKYMIDELQYEHILFSESSEIDINEGFIVNVNEIELDEELTDADYEIIKNNIMDDKEREDALDIDVDPEDMNIDDYYEQEDHMIVYED